MIAADTLYTYSSSSGSRTRRSIPIQRASASDGSHGLLMLNSFQEVDYETL